MHGTITEQVISQLDVCIQCNLAVQFFHVYNTTGTNNFSQYELDRPINCALYMTYATISLKRVNQPRQQEQC